MKPTWKHWSLFVIFIAIYGLLIPSTFAKKPSTNYPLIGQDNLEAEINRFIDATDPNLDIGVYVRSMKDGGTLYRKNDQTLFVPASILKVFTAESALLYLGPEYKFTTQFVTDAKSIDNGVLNGNLYLIHSGDPSLTYTDIAELTALLKAKQIQRIRGNVYIDNTAYDEETYGPGWLWSDKRYCYAAPISASIINHNCLTFHVAPGKSAGHLANVVPNPESFSPIENNVITKSASSRTCYVKLGSGSSTTLTITGCLAKGKVAQSVSTVVNDVMHYNQSLLASLFRRYQIRIDGDIKAGRAANELSVVATHESKPLRNLITEMLKMSDNIIAGSLFKKLGEVYTQRPGSWESGSAAVRQILAKKIGVNTTRMSVMDGSGLSRDNLITPAQMMQVLDFAYHHDASNYDFISALPVAGVDGTLKHRLRNVAWKVRAKTGTMKGVVALAGYAINRDKELIAFVLIVNGGSGFGWKYRALEDQIVTALTRYSRG